MAELPELTTSANLPPVPISALGRGIKDAPGPEAALAGEVGERPPADRSLWADLENEILLKRVTSALQPETLRATSPPRLHSMAKKSLSTRRPKTCLTHS